VRYRRAVPPGPVPPGPVPQARVVERDGMEIAQLQCPGCDAWGDLDVDQLHGRVSTWHAPEDGGCGFHETRDWSELLDA